MLGAGIRLGEAIAAQYPASSPDVGRKLAERIGALENRLLNLEVENPVPASAARPQPNVEDVRGELRDWLDESVTIRMAEVEKRLRMESELGQKQMLDAFAESVQARVVQRISRLEEEVAGQSAAMTELRDCSLRTERSMQQLLGGLERLIVKNPLAAEEAVNATPETPAGRPELPVIEPSFVEPPAFETRPEASRWKIFG